MPYALGPKNKARKRPSLRKLFKPLEAPLSNAILEARGNRPLQMTFEDQLHALIYFHLEEHASGRHLLHVLKEDDFAREE